jgi:hypothetical protein
MQLVILNRSTQHLLAYTGVVIHHNLIISSMKVLISVILLIAAISTVNADPCPGMPLHR